MEENISKRAKSRREHSAKAVDVVDAITVNADGEQVMTSLVIADITGRRHSNVMQTIRSLERAWENVVGAKFKLTSREVLQPNGGTRTEEYYTLNEHECLYIATKFNDEARARLVMRWMELERKAATPILAESSTQALTAIAERVARLEANAVQTSKTVNNIAMTAAGVAKSNIRRALGGALGDSFTVTHIANEIGVTASELNNFLCLVGVQELVDNEWILTAKYRNKDYAQRIRSKKGGYSYLVWSPIGYDLILELAAGLSVEDC